MPTTEQHIARGGSVCPFAVKANRIYAAVGPEPRRDRAALRAATGKFMFTWGYTPNWALLVTGTPEGYDATKLWAREVFCELMICFGLNFGVDEAEMERDVTRSVWPMLFDEQDPRRPVLGCGPQALYCICMSPLYPERHPRYAPETTIVVTWQADVAAIDRQTAAVARIRAVMEREHGTVYDADDLMLPLPVCGKCGYNHATEPQKARDEHIAIDGFHEIGTR